MIIVQQPTSIALVRSPLVYRLRLPELVLTNPIIYCDLYVWIGDSATLPSSPSHTISKFPNVYNEAIYDLSNIVQGYIYNRGLNQLTLESQNSLYEAVNVYCEFYYVADEGSGIATASNKIMAMNGYYDYTGGVNQSWDSGNYQSKEYLVPEWLKMILVADTQTIKEVVISDDQSNSYSIDLSAKSPTLSTERFVHINVGGNMFTAYGLAPTAYWNVSFKNEGGIEEYAYRYNILCEPKYSPLVVNYINDKGVWDYFVFQKLSRYSQTRRNESYENAHLWPYDNNPSYYDKEYGMHRNYLVNNSRIVECNTDFLNETENERIRQIMNSKRLTIQDGSDIYAVTIESNTFNEKTHVNDKLVQYTFAFKEAFDTINKSAV